uniref:Uncharacterized protein n=1 Tax=Leersia perrieri TaxID=77586 RepID=A0A0D9W4N1_9ORYZ
MRFLTVARSRYLASSLTATVTSRGVMRQADRSKHSTATAGTRTREGVEASEQGKASHPVGGVWFGPLDWGGKGGLV